MFYTAIGLILSATVVSLLCGLFCAAIITFLMGGFRSGQEMGALVWIAYIVVSFQTSLVVGLITAIATASAINLGGDTSQIFINASIAGGASSLLAIIVMKIRF